MAKVLTAGSSGLVGKHLLNFLLEDQRVTEVHALTRAGTSLPSSSSKLTLHPVDWENLSLESLPRIDLAFCTLGTTIKKAGSKEAFRRVDHDYVIAFAKLAKNAGARKLLLVSALGADASSSVFYNRVKGQTEADLADLGFESVVILRPSLLLGERAESRPAERLAIIATPILRPLLVGPFANYEPVKAEQVARIMKSAAFTSTLKLQILENREILKSG